MPIINKVIHNGTEYPFGRSGGGAYLDAISDLTATSGNAQISLTWTDPDDIVVPGYTFTKWKCTKLVRKVGSIPTDVNDGTLVATFTVRNGHTLTPYVDTGVESNITYYYVAFAISDGNKVTDGNSSSATPGDYRTFTVKRTEGSTITFTDYEDDAALLTVGSTEFDRFFGYSLTKVSTTGIVTEEVTQAQSGGAGKLDFTQLSSTSSGDNVMIKFPKRGIKMTKDGSTITLSITGDPNKAADGYNYYAFQSGDIKNITATYDQFFMGAFVSVDGGYSVSKSWSGRPPLTNQTQANACTYAKNNNGSLLWNIENPYMRWQLCAYAMMKWKNPNIQSIVGNGVVSSGSSIIDTGTLLNINNKDATYGTTTNSTTQVRLFGVEDFWGNVYKRIGGMYIYPLPSNPLLYTQLSGYSGTMSGGVSTGFTTHQTTGAYLSSIAGNNKAMFFPANTVSNGSPNTYYCDYVASLMGSIAIAGGRSVTLTGLFEIIMNQSEHSVSVNYGSRLVLLK